MSTKYRASGRPTGMTLIKFRRLLSQKTLQLPAYILIIGSIIFYHISIRCQLFVYDTVSDVVESGVQWRSNFQIGSRVLKICFKPIFMHIYGMQYDFMHRSCWNHSNFENSWFYNVISTSDPQNHCLLGSRNRVAVNFFNRYIIYWVVPCERARPELSE